MFKPLNKRKAATTLTPILQRRMITLLAGAFAVAVAVAIAVCRMDCKCSSDCTDGCVYDLTDEQLAERFGLPEDRARKLMKQLKNRRRNCKSGTYDVYFIETTTRGDFFCYELGQTIKMDAGWLYRVGITSKGEKGRYGTGTKKPPMNQKNLFYYPVVKNIDRSTAEAIELLLIYWYIHSKENYLNLKRPPGNKIDK